MTATSGAVRRLLAGAACAAALTASHAQHWDLGNGWSPSAMEIAQLPDYCQRFFTEKKVPPNCDGVHHLCAGKVLITRLSNVSIPKTERQRILRQATGEVGYMFTRHNEQCAYMDHARATQVQLRTWEMMLR